MPRGCPLVCLMLIAMPLAADERKPNVIVILSDDQGTLDAGCYGAPDLDTPGIDLLAKRGVRFTQFYAAAPVCSPSRSGLMTGRYPVRAGVPGNVSSTRGDKGMPAEQVTMAETFKAAGYATAHIGKWHLGYSNDTMPNAQGFDDSFGHMGGCIDNFSHFFYWQGPNRHDLWRNGEEVQHPGEFFPDLMVKEAKQFITQHREQPFFIYFAINCPHYPYQGTPEQLEKYARLEHPRNLYAAFVATMDARVKELIQHIDAQGLKDETIFVFQSDHGHSTEERAHFGGGYAGPYRGAKFSLFEGGIRVPALISWPGHLPEGVERSQVAHGCDWLPTLAELCGIKLLNNDIDGLSLKTVIEQESAPGPHEVLFWTIGNSWAVREGDWKLLGNPRDTSHKAPIPPEERLYLVNLQQDKTEMKNLASDHPEVVQRLQGKHRAWLKTWQKEGNPGTAD